MARFIFQNALWLVPVLFTLLVMVSSALLVLLSSRRRSHTADAGGSPELPEHEGDDLTDPPLRSQEPTDSEAERLRIVTEAHAEALESLESLISQAEGATHGASSDPLMASRAAESIAASARVTLNSMKRVVSSGGEKASLLGGEPTISSLTTLFSALEESSIPVTYEETGTAFPLHPEAELEVYRIVQECLNNSRTHGGPGTAVRVELGWSAQGLRLRDDDDGVQAARRFSSGEAPPAPADYVPLVDILQGRGMTDMKRRADALGGVFSAHRVPGVGFSVSVAFPTLKFHASSGGDRSPEQSR